MKTAQNKTIKTTFNLLLIFLITPFYMYSQNIELNSLSGEWKWTDEATSEEIYIYLKPGVFEIPASIGSGSEPCLLGVYKYYKDDVCVVDYYNELSDSKRSALYPIRILNTLSMSVRDYILKNGNGRNKILSGSSRIEYISDKMIRWVIIDDNHESLFSDTKMSFPDGTSLPTSIVFTRIE